MNQPSKGFSLIELLVALTLAVGLSTMMFQLFHQNERVIRDQTLIMEMQQTARVVVSQIADEVRMAGQGVPVYAAGFDNSPSEAAAVVLGSSNATRIDFRAGLSNVETTTGSNGPTDFTLGVPQTLSVNSSAGFLPGKFVYLSGSWAWLRAELTAESPTTLTLIPRETGGPDTSIHFAAAPTIALEEAVSFYLSSGSVRRSTAVNLGNLSNPVWSAANEVGRNFTALTFTYYDRNGNTVQPTTLPNRMAIARVDIQLTVEAASPLSNGTRPAYSLAVRTIPRNMRVQ